MTEALFGLLGVLVGAFAQAGGTWWMARRDERLTARTAARLTSGELMRNFLTIDATLEAGTWGPFLDAPLEHGRWHEHEAVFAATLGHSTWLAVYNAYREFEKLTTWIADSVGPDVPLSDAARTRLAAASEKAIEASAATFAVGIYGPGFSIRRTIYRVKSRIRPSTTDELEEDIRDFDDE